MLFIIIVTIAFQKHQVVNFVCGKIILVYIDGNGLCKIGTKFRGTIKGKIYEMN